MDVVNTAICATVLCFIHRDRGQATDAATSGARPTLGWQEMTMHPYLASALVILFLFGSTGADEHPIKRHDAVTTIMKKGEFSEALNMLSTIPDSKRDRLFYIYRALCRSNLGDDTGALADIIHVKSLQTSNSALPRQIEVERAWSVLLSSSHERPIITASFLRQSKLAVELADAAITQIPGDSHLLWLRANAYHAIQDDARALADLNEAIRRDPKNAQLYSTRAWIVSIQSLQAPKSHQNNAALNDYTESIHLHATPLAYYSRAREYFNLGDLEHAVNDLSEILRISRVSDFCRAHALMCRGILRKQMHDEAGAGQDFKMADSLRTGMVEQLNMPGPVDPDSRLNAILSDLWREGYAGFILDDLQRQRAAVDKKEGV